MTQGSLALRDDTGNVVLLYKQMKREPKRLTGTQGRKSQIKSVFRLRVCYFILLFFVT